MSLRGTLLVCGALSGCLMPDVKVGPKAVQSKSDSSQRDAGSGAAEVDATPERAHAAGRTASSDPADSGRNDADSAADGGLHEPVDASGAADAGAGSSVAVLKWAATQSLVSNAWISSSGAAHNQTGDVALWYWTESGSGASFNLKRFVAGSWKAGSWVLGWRGTDDVRYRNVHLSVEPSGAAQVLAQGYVHYDETMWQEYFWRWAEDDSVAREAPMLFTGAGALGYAVDLRARNESSDVAYLVRRSDMKHELFLTEREATGWTSPISVAMLDETVVGPVVSATNGASSELVVVIVPEMGANRPLRALVQHQGNVSSLTEIDLPFPISGAPALAIADDGSATLLAALDEPEGERLYAARAAGGSNQWSTLERVCDTAWAYARLSGVTNGDTTVLWIAAAPNASGPIVARAFDGDHWREPEALTQAIAHESMKLAESADGSRLLVWAQPSPAPRVLRYLLYKPGEGWSPPASLAEYTGNAALAEVSLDATGHALVAWRESTADATKFDIKWTRSL